MSSNILISLSEGFFRAVPAGKICIAPLYVEIPEESDAFKVNAKNPSFTGTPEMVPEELRRRPSGRLPDSRDQATFRICGGMTADL